MDKNTHDILTGVLIVAVILCALLVCQPKCANAESAIVSFNDAEHLVALQDSVAGVCDTIRPDSCATQPCPPTIICRELVSIAVMCYPWKDERTAIINYRRVKQ